jgi:membrane-associated phospholipid phosphatase
MVEDRTTARAYAAGAALTVALCALSACASTPGGRPWGADATVEPGWQRVGEAATGALRSPQFWGPLAAAAMFQIDNLDHRTSTWARSHTPIFGSQENAARWSDRLRSASAYAYVATVLVTPGGDAPREWLLDKARGVAVGGAAIVVTDEESALLKNATARERPNGQDMQSMPSSHASRSAVLTELAARNLESVSMGQTPRTVLDMGLAALTYGTAWARVESGYHFPSDTLVGISLGNFNGAFFNDAFLGTERSSTKVSFAVTPVRRGAVLQFRVSP